jgi:hypothetical protein
MTSSACFSTQRVEVDECASSGMLQSQQLLCRISSSTGRVQQLLVGRVTSQLICCSSCVLLQRIATEITVLQSLQHPLLPKLHQVYTTGDEICLEMTVSLHLKQFAFTQHTPGQPTS